MADAMSFAVLCATYCALVAIFMLTAFSASVIHAKIRGCNSALATRNFLDEFPSHIIKNLSDMEASSPTSASYTTISTFLTALSKFVATFNYAPMSSSVR